MNRILSFWFVSVLLLTAMAACRPTLHHQLAYPALLDRGDSVFVEVEAINLTEDVSRLSTKDDEILVLVYGLDDSTQISEPLIVGYTVMKADNRFHRFEGKAPTNWKNNGAVVVFMVEIDTDKTPSQIEAVFRVYQKEIIKAYKSGDRETLNKYLGDDDIVGIDVTHNMQLGRKSFEFKGVHKLDEFHYKLTLEFSRQK